MAETIEETLRRLDAIAADRPPTLAAEAGERPEDTIAYLDAIANRGQSRQSRIKPTFFGQDVSNVYGTSSLAEFLAGFNQAAGSAVGALATPVLGPLTRPAPGTPEREHLESLPAGERMDEEVRRSQSTALNFLRSIGVVPQDFQRPESLEAKVGASMVPAVMTAGTLLGLAPTLATRAGSAYMAQQGLTPSGTFAPVGGATSQTFGQLGAQAAARPATFTRAMLSGEVGAGAARETIREPLERALPGTEYPILAGATRAAVTFGAEVAAGLPFAYLANRVIPVPAAEAIKPTTFSGAILSGMSDPDIAGGVIRSRQVNVLDFIDRTIARTLERSANPNLSEADASIRLRQGLLAARDFVSDESERAYGVLRNLEANINGNPTRYGNILEAMQQHAAEFPGEAHNIPLDTIRAQIRQLAAQYDANGQVIAWRPDVPVWELARLRSALITEMWQASETSVLQSGRSRQLRDNVELLIDNLTNTIENIGVVDPRWKPAFDYANSTYRMYNDRFRRGPIGDILMTTRHTPLAREGQPYVPGTSNVPPTQVARQLLNANETAEAVYQALDNMSRLQGGTGPASTAVRNRVSGSVEDAIRAMFRDDILDFFEQAQLTARKPRAISDIPTQYSTQPGPAAQTVARAEKWLQDNEPLIKSWTKVTADTFKIAARLNRLFQARQAHYMDVASQFMGRRAEEVILESMRAPNVADRFASLHRQYRNVPDVLEGLQRGVVDAVFAGHGADPNIALDRMRHGPFRTALEKLFADSPGKLDRLYEATQAAAAITGTGVSSTASGTSRIVPGQIKLGVSDKIARGAATWGAGIFGLGFGNVLARTIPFMGGAGSLSIPMRMNRHFRNIVAASWLNDRVKALSYIQEMPFNADLEAWLRNSMPGGLVDAQRQLQLFERTARRIGYAINEDVDKYIIANGKRIRQEEDRNIRELERRLRQNPFRSQQ